MHHLPLIILSILLLLPCEGSSQNLDSLRWKKRVIIYDQLTYQQNKEFFKFTGDEENPLWVGLLERDIVFVKADEKLREQFNIQRSRPTFILLGKDGKEKGRQIGMLDLPKWFRLIDSMPMRQVEISKKN